MTKQNTNTPEIIDLNYAVECCEIINGNYDDFIGYSKCKNKAFFKWGFITQSPDDNSKLTWHFNIGDWAECFHSFYDELSNFGINLNIDLRESLCIYNGTLDKVLIFFGDEARVRFAQNILAFTKENHICANELLEIKKYNPRSSIPKNII